MTVEKAPTTRWDSFMVLVAMLSLVPIVVVELRSLTWDDPLFRMLAMVDLAFVAFFAVELVVRFARAPDRLRFVRENWYELLGLVPLYAESFALLRATRVLRLFRVFRALRALSFARGVVRESRIGLIIGLAGSMVLVLASAFYLAEHGRNPHLHTFGDAIWWALTTTSTVGYGDIVPSTTEGRVVAGIVMVGGVTVFGVVASSLTTAIRSVAGKEDALDALLRRHEDLVVRRERGELNEEQYAAALKDLRTLHK